jgi:teichuronic acid biosynthesis glycosyltransferase TuaC
MNPRILAITNIYPSLERPWLGTFVEQQVKGLLSVGVEAKVLFFDRKQEGPFIYYRMAQRIQEATAKFDPHLIHVMYGGVMADKIAARPGSKPVVVTFHGSDLLGENLSGIWRKLISYYGVRCSWRAARRAAGIVVVASHLERALPGDVDRRKVRVIPCGIDLDQFKPMDQDTCRQRLGWTPGAFHVLFPANVGDPVKRPWLAQAAVHALKEHGVNAELHMLSGIPYADVPLWINASDVLILTSLHEGSPTVVKEALACNVPVVSVDVGDVRERISGVEGCHLAAAEPRDLAQKLLAVWNRKARINAGPALSALSIRNIAERLKIFYCELLDARVACNGAEMGWQGDPLRSTSHG